MLPGLNASFHAAPSGGQRLFLHHTPPAGTPLRGGVLYLHPWAEEMNKARRMAAMASRALAADGWAVLQIDLLGCGDSSGDFGDATWDAWVDDAVMGATWLQRWIAGSSTTSPAGPLWLWGLRAGALLACAAAPRVSGAVNLLFWQPATQGKAQLQQFLRLKAAAQLADGGGKAILEATRADLAVGRPVDVAGYTLGPALARRLEAAQLAPPPTSHGAAQLVWLETSTQPNAQPSPGAQGAAPKWQAAGWATVLRSVPGPAFWQTTEIEEAPALIAETVACLAVVPASTDARRCAPAAPLPAAAS